MTQRAVIAEFELNPKDMGVLVTAAQKELSVARENDAYVSMFLFLMKGKEPERLLRFSPTKLRSINIVNILMSKIFSMRSRISM